MTQDLIEHGRHLGHRFFGAIRPGPPDPSDERWALTKLSDGERALWRQMNNPDRRHAVDVAKRVGAELGGGATRPVLAAALMHDVGKVVSGFRTPGRVVATLVWFVVPDERAADWVTGSGLSRRLGQYRLHPELGQQLLIEAGADELTSSWAADHHLDPSEWRIEACVGQVLRDCDDD